jgi:hypothetical protein
VGECSGDGSGVSMCLDPVYGNSLCSFRTSVTGLLSKPNPMQLDDETVGYSARSSTGKRTATTKFGASSQTNKVNDAGVSLILNTDVVTQSVPAGRLSWREIKDFK